MFHPAPPYVKTWPLILAPNFRPSCRYSKLFLPKGWHPALSSRGAGWEGGDSSLTGWGVRATLRCLSFESVNLHLFMQKGKQFPRGFHIILGGPRGRCLCSPAPAAGRSPAAGRGRTGSRAWRGGCRGAARCGRSPCRPRGTAPAAGGGGSLPLGRGTPPGTTQKARDISVG